MTGGNIVCLPVQAEKANASIRIIEYLGMDRTNHVGLPCLYWINQMKSIKGDHIVLQDMGFGNQRNSTKYIATPKAMSAISTTVIHNSE